MRNDVTLDDGVYGCRAVLRAGWDNSLVGYLTSNQVVELELNQAKGWRGSDLSFLTELPNLKLFEIFDFSIKDILPIHSLRELRTLGITTYCSTEICFSAFPNLQSCGLEWRPKATSLFDCSTMVKLFVNRYKAKHADEFAKLVNLESLTILNAPVETLRGLSVLKKLQSLRLGNLRRLTSLAGIEGLTALEELDMEACRKIGSIDEVGSLPRLKKLFPSNDGAIETLAPLEKLGQLERVTFVESTNILDGDLSPLLRQKYLSRVSFQNRRHYSHRREDLALLLHRVTNE